MSIVDVSDLVRIFFKYPISYIPIVDENAVGDTYLVGFLSRKKVLHYSSDKERLNKKFERIPDILISREIYPEHIWEFFEKSPIPVYNIFAKFIDMWQKNEINYNLKHFIYTLQNNIVRDEDKTKENHIDYEKIKLLEMILTSLPFPIFALDPNGNGIFYNEHFLKDIVDKGPFKKTLALAEAYFKEIVRKIIAESILQNLNTELMVWDWEEYKKKVYITNLIENNQVYAYLFTFLPMVEKKPSKNDIEKNHDYETKPSNLMELIEEELNKNKNYDEIIDNIESQIIKDYLIKFNYNITNTASALKIKRTTLQNKIKRLNLQREIKVLNEDFYQKEKNKSQEERGNNQNFKQEDVETKRKKLSKKANLQENIQEFGVENQKTKKKSSKRN